MKSRFRGSARCEGAPAARRGIRAAIAALGLALAAPLAHAQVTWSDIAPVFEERCVMCHSGETAPLFLRLDTLDGVLAGSSNGPVVKAGDPAGSELIRRLSGQSQPRMPMTGPPFLDEATVARIEQWIADGMPAGEKAASASPQPPAAPAEGEAVTWTHVAPLFARRCAKCHTDGGLRGPAPEGYRLDGYAAALDASDRARIVPGYPLASEVVRRVRGLSRPQMPFDGPPWLGSDEVALIERWIEGGARDAAGNPAPYPEGAKVRLGGTLTRRTSLNGLPIVTHGGTRLDRRHREGDVVQVRGRLGAGGIVRVDRMRPD